MIRCYIALGANLGQPLQQVQSALDSIAALPHCLLLRHSPWYRSRAIGPGEQADYINGVAAIATTLAATGLLSQLQAIESRHGRRREVRWGARTLDLDLLLFGDAVINTEQLTVPHPRLRERIFVLQPLADLAPELVLPCGTPIASLLKNCPRDGLRPLAAC